MAQSDPWKILAEPVVNPIPIKPSIPKNLFLVAGSLVFGALSALIKERNDYIFHTKSEIKDKIDYPLLGSIPFLTFINNEGDKNDNLEQSITNKFEAFRDNENNNYERFVYQESLNLSTSLRFIGIDNSNLYY